FGGDSSAPSCPWIFCYNPGAGHVKIKIRILLFQPTKLLVENDIIGGANAVEDGDFGFELAAGRLTHEAPEGRHAGTAGDANQMLVRFIDWQESAGWGNNYHLVACLRPIDDARAHFAVALDGHFVKAAIHGAGRKRISTLVGGSVRPK